jgi:hypothetical protein
MQLKEAYRCVWYLDKASRHFQKASEIKDDDQHLDLRLKAAIEAFASAVFTDRPDLTAPEHLVTRYETAVQRLNAMTTGLSDCCLEGDTGSAERHREQIRAETRSLWLDCDVYREALKEAYNLFPIGGKREDN